MLRMRFDFRAFAEYFFPYFIFLLPFCGACEVFGKTVPVVQVFACDTVSEEAISIIVDDMPEFPGDLPGWLHEMTSRFVESEGMKGRKPYRVVVRIVVEKDGSVTNPEILRGADSVLNAEALKIVGMMPKWKPGRHGGEAARVYSSFSLVFGTFTAPAAIYVVDGKQVAPSEARAIKTEDILHIKTLKRDAAVDIFGERGNNGAILIRTKNKNSRSHAMPLGPAWEVPVFPEDISEWLSKNIRYPLDAWRRGVEGKVVIRILVDKEGKVAKADVMRSVDAFLDAEALRVVRSMPRWKPGKRRGKNADFWLTIPINFRISSYKQENIP